MSIIEVNKKIFQLLKDSYSRNFGTSPSRLIDKLNNVFNYEIRPKSGGLISDKTIRNFFKTSIPPKTQVKNLNYLCSVLLDDVNSYDEAVEKYASKNNLDEKEVLQEYWNILNDRYGTMQVLDMTQSVDLDNIFTKVNIVSKKIRKQREIEEILNILDNIQSDTDSSQTDNQECISGLDAVKRYSKLMVLGLPGSGKTTFSKHIAMHFREDESGRIVVPIYLELKKIVECEGSRNYSCIINAVIQEFTQCINNSEKIVQGFLEQGECIILLDGLDEVRKEDINLVRRGIDSLVKQYPKNRFMITCRIAANDYVFSDFRIVEIADFGSEQIDSFVSKWFANQNKTEKAKVFLNNLRANSSLEELSRNPLLLTMLCMLFEKGYDLYKDRLTLYDDAVNIFLERWDSSRMVRRDPIVSDEQIGSEHNIEKSTRREEFYREKLSKRRKMNLLANIAYNGFTQEPPKRFWRKLELEQDIRTFIQNFSGIQTDSLDIDSQDILKALESNHGLIVEQARNFYAFSHLIFQEYFSAQYILENRDEHEQLLREIVDNHLLNQQWREVFLIIAGRLPNIDLLLKLMIERAKILVKSDALQEMLVWLNKITTSSGVQSSSWRAFFLTAGLTIDLYLDHDNKIEPYFAQQLAVNLRSFNAERRKIIQRTPRYKLILYLATILTLAFDKASNSEPELEKANDYLSYNLDLAKNIDIAEKLKNCIKIAEELEMTNFKNKLINLDKSLPDQEGVNSVSTWTEWAKSLQELVTQDLNIGYRKKLSKDDCRNLENYFYVNYLVVECLRGDTYSSKDLREKEIDNLLLISENI